MKKFKKIVIGVVLIAGGVFCFKKFNLGEKIKGLFSKKDVTNA